MKKTSLVAIGIVSILLVILVYATLPAPEHWVVCCAADDGICRDISVPLNEQNCGEHDWELVSYEKFCKNIDNCQKGCCTIRGKPQDLPMNKYECMTLCERAGVCQCTDKFDCIPNDLEWKWSPSICGNEYLTS